MRRGGKPMLGFVIACQFGKGSVADRFDLRLADYSHQVGNPRVAGICGVFLEQGANYVAHFY